MTMFADVVLASSTALAPPLYTLHLRYPRIIHSELMTHRVFSRNARSSRAVPVKTMLEEVRTNPFVPWHWLKNQPGMQGSVPLTDDERREAEALWLAPLPGVIWSVEQMMNPEGLSVHKQNPNRLLEPWMFIDTLVTATNWSNFLWLRDHSDAEPHFRDLAQMVKEAIDGAEVQELKPGEWHLPYVTDEDRWSLNDEQLPKISAARSARISYMPFDGGSATDYDRELTRYDLLVGDGTQPVHASPLEHQATPDGRLIHDQIKAPLSGNLDTGWIQFRKTVRGECR